MNILIPHTWLLEHLDTQATPDQIQKIVSLSGPSIERIYEIEGESVYDIEVTTNRVDSMSVRGIAREAAVILTQAGVRASLKPLAKSANAFGEQHSTLPLPQIFNDPKLCKRIVCQVIGNVQKTPSPDWMQKRLRQIGVNVHDSIIDITNYITHDLGHPCHAFDYDKVMALGGQIHVKEAVKDKKFVIIDGTEYETVGGEVVFENEQGEIIDLPAIKGTKNTSIADDTKNLLFWMEDIDAKKVRFASMTHAIRTVAAQLNEKNVDPNLADDEFEKGVELFTTLSHGTVSSERHDEFPGKSQVRGIRFQVSEILRYLGVEIPTERIVSILESLECKVEKTNDTELTVIVPTFRPDLEISADIVEEIARIYGYHNLPSTLMEGKIPTQKPEGVDFDTEWDAKTFLSALGAYEVYTYSMIDAKKAVEEGGEHVEILNPLTEDMTHLRTTLWTSHLSVLAANAMHRQITVFEFANVYIPTSSGLPNEEFHLTLTSTEDERRVKGMLQAIAKKYFIETLRYSDYKIFAGKSEIGSVVYPQKDIVVLDIRWSELLSLMRKYPLYQPDSKFTPIVEDLTFTVPKGQLIGSILTTIENCESVKLVSLKDLYKQNATFSITYTSDHQLDATEATVIRERIVNAVTEGHPQTTLIGKI